MESETTLTPREKSPLPEKNLPRGGSNHDAASSRTASPTHYQGAIRAPNHPQTSTTQYPEDMYIQILPASHASPLCPKTRSTQYPEDIYNKSLPWIHRLVSLVARRPPWERKIPGSNPACAGIFSGSSHTSDFKIGTPVATLPGAWRYRVSTGTGRPGVSILWLGEVERLICNFYLSVAACKIVCADPSLRYTSLLLGR